VGLVVGGIAFGVAFFLARSLVSGLLGGGGIAESDWQEVVPQTGRVRILMPGNPKKEIKQVVNNTLESYIVTRDGGRVEFSVYVSQHPDHELQVVPWEQRFQLFLKGLLVAPSSQLKAEKALTLAGNTGREFIVEVPNKGIIVTRSYGVRQGGKNLFVNLSAAGPSFGPETPAVAKFFDSLQLEKEGAVQQEVPADLPEQLAKAPPGKRTVLISALRKQPDAARKAVPALAEVVKDLRDYLAASDAAELLAELGPAASEAGPALTAVLKTQHPRKLAPDNGNIRLHVAGALARINPKDDFARQVLRDCTKDSNTVVRIGAFSYLVLIDPAGNGADLEALVRIWRTDNLERENAANGLKKLGPLAAKAVPVLVEEVGGKNNELRRSAVEVLGRLGATARPALAALRALDQPGSPDDLRQAVQEACKRIEAGP
jgi:hypothetical protein